MEEKIQLQAKEIFDRFVACLNKKGWKFDTQEDDGDYVIIIGVCGEDLPMDLFITVDTKRQLLTLLSKLPFDMDKEKLLEGAVATSMINHVLADGSFDYDVQDGSIYFRMTTSWRGGLISDEVFEYMLIVSGHTIDKYNDKLLMVSKGVVSVADLHKFIYSE